MGRTVELHGRELLPWLGARELSDQEVGELRQGRTIPTGDIVAAEWSAPAGFPPPQPLVRGFHLSRLRFLLKSIDEQLGAATTFHGGV